MAAPNKDNGNRRPQEAPAAPAKGNSGNNGGEPIIEAHGVAKLFSGRKVLKDVSLIVRRGETVAVMGGSGCGKTTLLRLMMGVYKPDAGQLRLFGKDIGKMNREELNGVRKRFGIVFQFGALYNSMTVGDNVALPLREHTDLDEKIIEIMVKMKLDLVRLRGFEKYMPAQISGGMQKRAGLARALALDPEILFYDEPTAGLDPVTSGEITQLIYDLNKKLGVTSVVVTHDRECAFRTADRIALMYAGEMIEEGPPEQIKNSGNAIVKQFITGSPDGPISFQEGKKDLIEDLVGEGDEEDRPSALRTLISTLVILIPVLLGLLWMVYYFSQ